MLWIFMYLLSDCYLSKFSYFIRSAYILLRIILGCLQWISTHTWVMALCAISISHRAELIRATLSTIHVFLSHIPLGFIFESPLVGSFSAQNEFVVEEITYWNPLTFADIAAWDTYKVFPGISEPNVAMFNRGMFHPWSSNVLYEFFYIDIHFLCLQVASNQFGSFYDV
jgi:hypothetical protein